MNKDKLDNEVVYLRIDDIIPNRFQPREIFDETGLEELSDSIKEHGIIQPIVVRPIGDKYELIAGERRTKASALAGLTTIPAIVRDMDDTESAKVSLLENLQRKNLSAIEEARTYKRILDLANMTQEELAKTMGKSQPMVANKLRLLALPEEVQDALIKNQISERHARSLLNIKNKQEQLKLLDRIRDERLTVRELDKVIKEMKENNTENNAIVQGGASMNNGMPNYNSTQSSQNQYGMQQGYSRNFGNMGLNDYQSTINNGMFNNIPNFNNTENTMPQTNIGSMASVENSNSNNNNYDYSSFDSSKDFKMPTEENNNYFDIPNNNSTPGNYSSLGSMFDGNNTNSNVQSDFSLNSDNNANNQNLFVSQIRENDTRPSENQFLPNFDTMPNNMGNNEFMPSNNMMGMSNSMPNDFQVNNQNTNYMNFAPNNGMNEFNSGFGDLNQNFGQSNFGINQNNGGLDGINNYQKPIEDFAFPSNNPQSNYSVPQGGLFNQPLNIVDVPGSSGPNDTSMSFNEDTKPTGENNKEENNETDKSEEAPDVSKSEFSDLFNIPAVPVEPSEPTENKENEPEVSGEEAKDEDNKDNNQEEKETENNGQEENTSESSDIEEVEVIDTIGNETKEETSNVAETTNEGETNQTLETVTINTAPETPEEVKEDNKNNNQYISLEPVKTIFDTRGAVLELKKTTDAIKQNNISIDTEEIEFDDYYQITIKIKK